MSGGWPWADPPKPMMHEPGPPSKPLLYGPTGEPLVSVPRVVGFKPVMPPNVVEPGNRGPVRGSA